MSGFSKAFSGFAVKDLAASRQFYQAVLDVTVEDTGGMGLQLSFEDGMKVFIYEKPDHEPAGFTILNFPVDDIDTAINNLAAKGVTFETYDDPNMPQDEKGVLRGRAAGYGPDIAWFRDPSGNLLSVLQN